MTVFPTHPTTMTRITAAIATFATKAGRLDVLPWYKLSWTGITRLRGLDTRRTTHDDHNNKVSDGSSTTHDKAFEEGQISDSRQKMGRKPTSIRLEATETEHQRSKPSDEIGWFSPSQHIQEANNPQATTSDTMIGGVLDNQIKEAESENFLSSNLSSKGFWDYCEDYCDRMARIERMRVLVEEKELEQRLKKLKDGGT
jgi:hypothetical protein